MRLAMEASMLQGAGGAGGGEEEEEDEEMRRVLEESMRPVQVFGGMGGMGGGKKLDAPVVAILEGEEQDLIYQMMQSGLSEVHVRSRSVFMASPVGFVRSFWGCPQSV